MYPAALAHVVVCVVTAVWDLDTQHTHFALLMLPYHTRQQSLLKHSGLHSRLSCNTTSLVCCIYSCALVDT